MSEIPETCKICAGIEHTEKCLQYAGLETETDEYIRAFCPKCGGRSR